MYLRKCLNIGGRQFVSGVMDGRPVVLLFFIIFWRCSEKCILYM
jgi:hypothetical protein